MNPWIPDFISLSLNINFDCGVRKALFFCCQFSGLRFEFWRHRIRKWRCSCTLVERTGYHCCCSGGAHCTLHTTHSTVLCMLCSTQSSVCLGLQQGYGMQLGSPQCHCMPRYLSRHSVKYHLCQRVPELYRDYAMACHGCAMCQKTMVDPICHIYVCLWTWKMQYPVCPVSTAQSFQAIAMNRKRVVVYFCLLEYNWGCLWGASGANFEAGVKNWCSLELHQEGGRWHTEAASLVQSSGSASGRLNHHQH